MNCKEAIDLAEEALDKDLPRAVKRRLDLHLSRCESCRRLFEAERYEHVRWFRIFNDPAAMRSLPPGFADRLVASAHLARPGFWFRIPRWAKIAASLLALASFVSFAAVVVVGRGVLDAPESADGEEMAGRVVPTRRIRCLATTSNRLPTPNFSTHNYHLQPINYHLLTIN